MGLKLSRIFLWGFALFSQLSPPLACAETAPRPFVRHFIRPVEHLNPFTQTGYVGTSIGGLVFDTLLSQDSDTWKIGPSLAERWQISPDLKTYALFLRKDAVFSDGQPVTAEDIKFTFEAHRDARYKSIRMPDFLGQGATVSLKDAHTVLFTLEKPNHRFLDFLVSFWVLPRHFYGDTSREAEWPKKMIGSGPYEVKKFVTGSRTEFHKRPDWWGNKAGEFKGKHNFERITFRYVSDLSIANELLIAGEIDLVEIFDPQNYFDLLSRLKSGQKVLAVKADGVAMPGEVGLKLNFRNPLFQDQRVRKAMVQLFDREMVNEKLFRGIYRVKTGPWGQVGPNADASVKPLPFDPKGAQKLLWAAGWKDSNQDGLLEKIIEGKEVPLRFTLMIIHPSFQKLATLYKEAARAVGIEVMVKQVHPQESYRLLTENNFDTYLFDRAWSDLDPDLEKNYHSRFADDLRSLNSVGYKNPALDPLLEEHTKTKDYKKRQALARKIFRMLAEDLVEIPLFEERYALYGVSTRIKRPKDSLKFRIGFDSWADK